MTSFTTSDGLALEATWSPPGGEPAGVVVLCHPDPRQQGTMNAPLMRAVAGRLADAGFHVLRFNFRGVGGSEGAWGGGDLEVLDVDAAVAHARAAHPALRLCLAGWSFGAVTALRWQAAEGDASPYAGVAPPVAHDDSAVLPDPGDLVPAHRLIVVGDRDQFTTVDESRAYAGEIGARFEVLAGSDHFFVFRDVQVGRLVADHFLSVPD